jgi:hypothetical protein
MLRASRGAATPRVAGMRPRERWPELWQFFAGYLHQDFDLDGTAEECVEHAIGDRGPGSLAEVDMSLRELRAQDWSEARLARALDDLGMEYLPYPDGRTHAEWVAWVHHQVVVARE